MEVWFIIRIFFIFLTWLFFNETYGIGFLPFCVLVGIIVVIDTVDDHIKGYK